MGTTIATSSSFAQNLSIKLKTSAFGIGFTPNAGFTDTSTDSNSETITKSTTLAFPNFYGGADGIDHTNDWVIVVLNPAVGAVQERADPGNDSCVPVGAVDWSMGLSDKGPSHSNTTEDLYKIKLQWALDQTTMPADVADILINQQHFTKQDFAEIAALDPFASGASTIDSTRYSLTQFSFPYIPLAKVSGGGFSCGNPFAQTITNALQDTHTTGTSRSTNAGFELSAGFNIGILSSTVTENTQFTWTHSSSQANITGSNQSATVMIGCASPSYNGPADVLVYWDKLFGSFMFAMPPTSAAVKKVHTGQLVRTSGEPLARARVKVEYNGRLYHTVTDNNGNYSIYSTDVTAGIKTATVVTEGHQFVVPVSVGKGETTKVPPSQE